MRPVAWNTNKEDRSCHRLYHAIKQIYGPFEIRPHSAGRRSFIIDESVSWFIIMNFTYQGVIPASYWWSVLSKCDTLLLLCLPWRVIILSIINTKCRRLMDSNCNLLTNRKREKIQEISFSAKPLHISFAERDSEVLSLEFS